jgi:hypothetical protein
MKWRNALLKLSREHPQALVMTYSTTQSTK